MSRLVTAGSAATNRKGPAERDYVALVVSDTGAGMSLETRARVFDPFFTTKSAGRGLGLWVVHGIVGIFGGSIEIASEPGQGTKVEILLPSAGVAAASAIEPGSGGAASAPVPQRIAVLVVEDEDVLRQAAVKILRLQGFDVQEASDGTAAIEIVRASGHSIEVILLDMTLPGASSQEIVAEAVKIRPDVKVILTSAYSKEMLGEKISAPQVRNFIRKPFRLTDLVKILQDAVLSSSEETG